ncbi:MAG TPA: Gfo/Idh/MocA family oxidoreductase [Verrucomicrobiae bacterium]|nr:Gfo/Idh/MocA family oxidoreductase [Verrucomicrobiae bacterium]
MVNVGIVGLGFMAATHIKAYRQVPGARIAAICNPSGRNLDGDFSAISGNVGSKEPIRLDMNEVRAYTDYAAFLNDPSIDLVDICSPTLAHTGHAIAALKAGKHVVCEKPLARTSAEARRIVEAAAHAKGFFMPAMCMRFCPSWAWLKEAVDQHTYGRVLAARFRRVAEPPGWGQQHFHDGAKSGGALLDLHIHDVDFVQFLFGRPHSVYATGYTKFSGAIDHVVAQYEVASDAKVMTEGAWAMTPGFGFNMAYTVNFEKATADFDLARGAEALKLFVAGQPARVVEAAPGDGYIGELRHVVEAVQNGRSPTVVTAQDGLGAVEICEAEELSISTGQMVTLPE